MHFNQDFYYCWTCFVFKTKLKNLRVSFIYSYIKVDFCVILFVQEKSKGKIMLLFQNNRSKGNLWWIMLLHGSYFITNRLHYKKYYACKSVNTFGCCMTHWQLHVLFQHNYTGVVVTHLSFLANWQLAVIYSVHFIMSMDSSPYYCGMSAGLLVKSTFECWQSLS